MSSDQLKRIALALGTLLVLWLVLIGIRRLGEDEPSALAPPALDRGAVDAITIARPEDTIRLAKHGAQWTVNGFAASTTIVNELFDAVTDTARSELVAENRSTHQQLGVDSAQGRRLELSSGGNVLLGYLVGKRGANWETAYVRLPAEDAVYQVRGRLVEIVERRVDDWRDRSIVQVDPDSLTGIEITRGQESFTLAKVDSLWQLPGGEATDSARIASLLGRFRRLEASGFATAAQADSADFGKPERQVRLLGLRGKPLATLLFDSTAGGFWVWRDTMPIVFRMDSWAVDDLTPADSTLKKRG